MIPTIGHNGGPKLELTLRDYQVEAVEALFDYFNTYGGNNADGSPKRANPLICLPTGTGKSLVIAAFIALAMWEYPQTRVLMATHVKELIKQNAAKMLEAWPTAPLGVYSAGLKLRDSASPIVFGGVQSLAGKFPIFGYRDFLVIDEAHLVGEEGRYLKLIEELLARNPYLKVIGLSATPYRLGLGSLTNGKIFTHVAFDMCNIDGFNRLLALGYLCPLIPKPTEIRLNVSNVSSTGGDYNQNELQTAVDVSEITYKALSEAVGEGFDRACWMVFASGVKHADHIAEMLNSAFGISAVTYHSKNTDAQNLDNLKAWKQGKVRCIVNMNGLTTGVDHPPLDYIIMLRPTQSTGLWVQMLGRGTRPYDPATAEIWLREAFPFAKQNCKVMDFAGNIARLGPINDPVIPKKKGEGPPGDAPVKVCKAILVSGFQCSTYNHTLAKYCIACGTEFTFQENLHAKASTLELIRSDLPHYEWFKVNKVIMTAHTSKSSGKNSIKVAYYCSNFKTFYEFKSVGSTSSIFRHKSKEWFRQRYDYSTPVYMVAQVNTLLDGSVDDVPNNDDDVLRLAPKMRHPMRIQVHINKQTPEIIGYEF